jgi:hypothetical protein
MGLRRIRVTSGDGLVGGHVVAEHLGHAADRSAARDDGREGEAGSLWAEPALGHERSLSGVRSDAGRCAQAGEDPHFPDIAQPENHVRVAHCGFFGVVPPSFATERTLRPRVLEIVDLRANVIDARLPLGDVTMIKISSDMRTPAVTPAELSSYKQYENSDCLNGAVLRAQDGDGFVESTPSHHVIIAVGDLTRCLVQMAQVWGLELDLGPAPTSTTPSVPFLREVPCPQSTTRIPPSASLPRRIRLGGTATASCQIEGSVDVDGAAVSCTPLDLTSTRGSSTARWSGASHRG